VSKTEAARIFAQERKRFSAVFPHAIHIRLVILDRPCTTKKHCKFRDVALAWPDKSIIEILDRALSLSEANIRGLFRHELGHMCDVDVAKSSAEQRADDIARCVTGEKIRYDQNDIQTISKSGKYPRPRHLHR